MARLVTVVFLLALALPLAGCNARLLGEDISTLSPGERISGIPYRLKEPYTLKVYRLMRDLDGKPIMKNCQPVYEAVHTQPQLLANQMKVYSSGMIAEALANHTLKLEFNDDGTLKTFAVTAETHAPQALAAASESLKQVTDAIADFETKKIDDELALAKKRAEVREYEAGVALEPILDEEKKQEAAQAAILEVYLAQAKQDSLPPDASAADVQAAKNALQAAKLKANHAYRDYGLEPPFPDVFP